MDGKVSFAVSSPLSSHGAMARVGGRIVGDEDEGGFKSRCELWQGARSERGETGEKGGSGGKRSGKGRKLTRAWMAACMGPVARIAVVPKRRSIQRGEGKECEIGFGVWVVPHRSARRSEWEKSKRIRSTCATTRGTKADTATNSSNSNTRTGDCATPTIPSAPRAVPLLCAYADRLRAISYRNDSLIRKESEYGAAVVAPPLILLRSVYISPLAIAELKRIVEASEVIKEDDAKWPKKNIVGKQELEIKLGDHHISFEVSPPRSATFSGGDIDPVFYHPDRKDWITRGRASVGRSRRNARLLLPRSGSQSAFL